MRRDGNGRKVYMKLSTALKKRRCVAVEGTVRWNGDRLENIGKKI